MLSRPSRRARRVHRAGLTLVELLVVIVLLAIVGGGMMRIVVRQQQFYTGTSGVIETRSSVRQGIEVVQRELRGLAPADGDIYVMGPNLIEFRASAGSSVVCTIDGARTTVTVPPSAVAAQNGLTSWITAPLQSDSLLVYNADSSRWQRTRLAAAPQSGANCPMATGLTTVASEENRGWTLSLDAALESGVKPGAAIRFVRRAHYQLYQAADSRWYLGYFECVPSAVPTCSTIQPVSGPYLPAGGSGGLQFAYFDAAGAPTADPTRVKRIDIVVRAQSSASIQGSGYTRGVHKDSLAVSISVRN
jgi:prepilin-type N-terminal cleavage/methylation domain-containing protein